MSDSLSMDKFLVHVGDYSIQDVKRRPWQLLIYLFNMIPQVIKYSTVSLLKKWMFKQDDSSNNQIFFYFQLRR